LRATYDAGHGFGLPELHITPPAVVLKAHDPNAREISFSVRIQQADGPAFDPAIHRIDLVLTAPWHEADVHWEWSNDRLPADVAFTLAFPDGFFKPATSLTGDIELAVRARDR